MVLTSSDHAAGFDVLAPHYRWLERLAFGGDLEKARFLHLGALEDRRRILILGEGDGRCLARLVAIAPQAEIVCVDGSGAMLAEAARRLPETARPRVRFVQADARAQDFGAASFDAVVTLFFLDCFPADEVNALIGQIGRALAPGGCWVYADFALPERGWRRARARVWLALLYAFFRWQTGLPARRLPPAEGLIRAHGFRPLAEAELQHGLLRALLLSRRGHDE